MSKNEQSKDDDVTKAVDAEIVGEGEQEGGPRGVLSARRVSGGKAGGGRRGGSARGGVSNKEAAAAGRKILKQLLGRFDTEADGDDQKPLQKALRGVARGYKALEDEVARLNEELEKLR
jgi:hypothetical protein